MIDVDRERRRTSGRVFRGSLLALAVESLETRVVLSATYNGAWPGPHAIALTLNNATATSQIAGYSATMNAAQYAAGTNTAQFNGLITGPAGNAFHAGDAEVHFFPNGTSTASPNQTAFIDSSMDGTLASNQVRFNGNAAVPVIANAGNTIIVTAIRPPAGSYPVAVVFADSDVTPDTPGGTPVNSSRTSAIHVLVDTLTPTTFLPTNVPVRNTSIRFTGTDPGTTPSGIASITITDSARSGFSMVVPGNGATSVNGTYTFGGVQGSRTVTEVVVDRAGNMSTEQENYTFDSIAPPAPSAPDLEALSDTGPSSSDNVTSDPSPTFDVVVPAADGGTTYASLALFRSDNANTPVATITNPASGPLTITDPAVANGTYTYSTRLTDQAGNATNSGSGLSVTITNPAAPAPPDLQPASDSGNANDDNITRNTSLVFSVQADPNATVRLSRDGNPVGASGSAGAGGGTITLTDPGPVPDGLHLYTVKQTAAGTTSPDSQALSVTVDTVAPARPAQPTLLAADDSGTQGDNRTNVRRPRITGNAEPGSIVQILDGSGNVLGTGTAGGSGTYTVQVSSNLPDGSGSIRVQATDVAGNPSTISDPLTLTIDATAPATTGAPDLQATSDTGTSSTDNVTSDTSPTFDVAAVEPGATLQLFRDDNPGVPVATLAATAGGLVAITDPGPAPASGIGVYTAVQLDRAGNASVASPALRVTFIAAAPPGSPDLQSASDSGASNVDNRTNLTHPTFDAQADPNATVQLFRDGVAVGTPATAGATGGLVALTDPGRVPDGVHLYQTRQTAGGSTSPLSPALMVTIDTVAPARPGQPTLLAADDSGTQGDNRTNVRRPRITGNAESGSIVQILDASGNVLGTGTAGGSGTYTVQVASNLPDGSGSIRVQATDVAGNPSTISDPLTLTIDATAPAATGAPDLQATSDTGTSSTDNVTSDTSPTFDVAAVEPGATLQLFRDDNPGVPVATLAATAGGLVAITDPGPAPASGIGVYTAVQLDRAGNASVASPALRVTFIAAAPPGSPDLQSASDSGASNVDNRTNLTHPTFDAQADPNATVQLFRDGVAVGTPATAGATGGLVALTDPGRVPDGVHLYQTRQTAGGSTSPLSPALMVTIDTVAPAKPAQPTLLAADDSGVVGDNRTNVRQPRITGNAEPGSTVQLIDGSGNVLGSAIASAAGNYQVQPASPLADGTDALRTRAVDDSGNASAISDPLALIIDGTAPAAPTTPVLLETEPGDRNTADDVTRSANLTFHITGVEPGAAVVLNRTGVGTVGGGGSGSGGGSGGGGSGGGGGGGTGGGGGGGTGPGTGGGTGGGGGPSGGVTDSMVVATGTAGPDGTINLVDVGPSAGIDDYTVHVTDLTGNASPSSSPLRVVIDRTVPTVSGVQIAPADLTPSTGTLTVPQTSSTSPTIQFSLLEQTYAAKSNLVLVELFSPSGQRLDSATIEASNGTSVDQAVSGSLRASGLAPGQQTLTIQATDIAGNVTSTKFTLAVTQSTPATPGSPGTPVYSTVWDLNSVGGTNVLQPWTQAFDRTTQTVWFTNENSNGITQFDPATGKMTVYDVSIAPGLTSDPHGTFFDFETHLTPRFWFVDRNAAVSAAEPGRVSYLDIATQELLSVDLTKLTGEDPSKPIQETHAVTVDRRGHIWISAEASSQLIEIDLTTQPDGTPNPSLNSRTGRVIIHQLPQGMGTRVVNGQTVGDGFHIHGLDVVVGDDGRTYVWASDEGDASDPNSIQSGRFALLVPGSAPGQQDRWFEWNVDQALATEAAQAGQTGFRKAQASFVAVDTSETPGDPTDDKIIVSDPGFVGRGQTAGIIRVFDASTFIKAIQAGGPLPTALPVKTIQIPKIPGSSPGSTYAAPAQSFLDREGNVYYVDQLGGIGRLNPEQMDGSVIQAPIGAFTQTQGAYLPITFQVVPNSVKTVQLQAKPGLDAAQFTQDRSQLTGVDQYEVTLAGSSGIPGPFRGSLSAGSVLFGSLAKANAFSSTVFAETDRRQLAVANTPGGGRWAFQTLRSGHVILTYRQDGGLFDRQLDLTSTINGPTIVGDLSAVLGGDGLVHAYGRDASGGISEYLVDPARLLFAARSVAALPAGIGILDANPTAFLFGASGDSAAGLVTTGGGHLLLFNDLGNVIDLTAAVGAGPDTLVYSSVGVTRVNGMIYAYGTDQKGKLIEYSFPAAGGAVSSRVVTVPAGADPRALMVFQDVEAVASIDGVRHVFAVDGSARLVHYAIGGPGGDTAENLTQQFASTAVGYTTYQQPFAGRIYTDFSAAIDPTTGRMLVYGTNGRDLVEYRQQAGSWAITDMTNSLAAGQPANRVFGAPTVHIAANGDRQILLISEDAEVIEYAQQAGFQYTTSNITLAAGNSGSPAVFPPTVAPPTTPSPVIFVGPIALSPDSVGLNATGQGYVAPSGQLSPFRFTARFSGKVTFTIIPVDAGLDPNVTVTLGKKSSHAKNHKKGTIVISTITITVKAGQVVQISVGRNRKTSGGFNISAHYLSVVHPKATVARKAATKK